MRTTRKLIVLKGLPESGTSDYAQALLTQNKNAVRLSKNGLRSVIHGGLLWSDKREHIVIAAHFALLKEMMRQDKDIIIDDINLNPNHVKKYEKIAKDEDYDFQMIEMDLPIKGLDNRYGFNIQNAEFVIYGLDHILANVDERLHLSTMDGQINLEIYDDPELIPLDQLNEDVAERLNKDFLMGFKIIILDDRPESTRAKTERWLEKNSIHFDKLILRKDDDERSEIEFKEWVMKNYLPKYMCNCVYEHDQDTIKMWDMLDITTIDVTPEYVEGTEA